ncbi:hypothetical protein ACM16X_16695 [Haloarcula japonica]|uniref:hypothetical protein n=1 Tax=Haloarcula japonica TaxID=29282 RepID=UPI0039F6DDA6
MTANRMFWLYSKHFLGCNIRKNFNKVETTDDIVVGMNLERTIGEDARIALLTCLSALVLLAGGVGGAVATADGALVILGITVASPIPGDSVVAYSVVTASSGTITFFAGPGLAPRGVMQMLKSLGYAL